MIEPDPDGPKMDEKLYGRKKVGGINVSQLSDEHSLRIEELIPSEELNQIPLEEAKISELSLRYKEPSGLQGILSPPVGMGHP